MIRTKVFTRLRNMSIQGKMIAVSLAANLLVFLVNIVLLMGINSMSDRMDTVYQGNLYLNQVSSAIDDVQNAMKEYLSTKTSDALEDYYRYEQDYRSIISEMKTRVTGTAFVRMERDIKYMSTEYLEEVDHTIEAKRGRNVEKYRAGYDSATRLYEYIKTYIYSLNNEQFMENSSNYSDMLTAFRRFETVSNLVMIVVILGNIFLITRLTMELVRPLRELTSVAEEVAKGNFMVEPVVVRGRDEIGVVSEAFNSMIDSIRRYIEELRESMEAQQELKERELKMENNLKDAQLKYLQAQINPHFLFNTLNAGAQLAMMEGADRTYEYVQHMADFFRYNVNKNSQTVTIRDEIEQIDNYIYILNVRYSGDIKYEKHLDKALLDVEMPGMILQPIVENCVKHGIKQMMGEGRIKLKVYRIDDMACISVSDNGTGMSEETIQGILSKPAIHDSTSPEPHGIGMYNVLNRLRLFTGDEDSLSILSEEGKGTEFIVYLNIKRMMT